MKLLNTLKKSLITINTIFLVWLVLSFLEIVIKNLDSPTYNPLNLFVLVMGL